MPEALSRAVAVVVARLMTEHGMSGRALALAAGINPRSMDRKLAGVSPFDLDDVAAIAPALGVTATDLIGWADHT